MRFLPLYHFVAFPIAAFFFVHTLIHAAQDPSLLHAAEVVFAFGLVAAVLSSRLMALAVQNRVIRLEMRLRLKEILPPALAARIPELGTKQLIALRFASDAEMPALMERVLQGEFEKPRDIKRAVKDWQPDYLRA
jgi:hypothetical protein